MALKYESLDSKLNLAAIQEEAKVIVSSVR